MIIYMTKVFRKLSNIWVSLWKNHHGAGVGVECTDWYSSCLWIRQELEVHHTHAFPGEPGNFRYSCGSCNWSVQSLEVKRSGRPLTLRNFFLSTAPFLSCLSLYVSHRHLSEAHVGATDERIEAPSLISLLFWLFCLLYLFLSKNLVKMSSVTDF